MNKIIIITLALFMLGCIDKKKKQEKFVMPEEQLLIQRESGLNENFAQELRLWMNQVETRYDTAWNDKKYYTIEFFQKKWQSHELGNDTLVILSYYSTTRDYLGYRGIFKLDKRNIAMFDKDSIGTTYYDQNILKYVPLEHFSSGGFPERPVVIKMFFLKNGILERKIRF